MRPAVLFLVATALSIGPRTALAQVSVTSPAAGAKSSYRSTAISWDPIPGATSYHLEIDDDPNFGSPEVDVTVAGTSYTLSGERLNLNGQQSWAAYVRINGKRWNANSFTPSYLPWGIPALGVDSQNKLYIAFEDARDRIQLTASSDWSSFTRLSLADTFNTYGLNLAVDEQDVVHASWLEQRPTESWVPYYTKSSTGWNLVRIPGTTRGGCSEGSIVAGGGQVDLFYEECGDGIERWTTTDGLAFTRTRIPNNDSATSASAGRDGVGNLYVASERDTVDDPHSSVQTSADGWIPHRIGQARFPALAITPTGGSHVLRWSDGDDGLPGTDFLYSNSLRGFQTWSKLPTTSTVAFDQDILPLVVDETGDRLYAALPAQSGIQLCSAPNTGRATDTGTSWSCSAVGKDWDANHPDLALAPDGTLHLAWSGDSGLAYANSLGSFLATNVTPHVTFGTPSGGASAVTVPATISDVDGDEMAGHVQVGRFQHVVSLIEPGTTEKILNRLYTLGNSENSYIYDTGNRLQFRVMGGASWEFSLHRSGLALPAHVEVRHSGGEVLGGVIIASWDDAGITIAQIDFVPYVKLTFDAALPSEIDISTLPVGAAMVAIGVSDRVTSSFAAQAFTKISGQNTLRLVPLTGQ